MEGGGRPFSGVARTRGKINAAADAGSVLGAPFARNFSDIST